MFRIKITITLLLTLIVFTANSQLRKISTLKLLQVPKRNGFYHKFEVRNGFIYLSVDEKIRKIDFSGEIVDSMQFTCKDSTTSHCFEFEVTKHDKQNRDMLYYSLYSCQSVGIANEFKTINRISLNEILLNKIDSIEYAFYGFCIDENKNIYVRHSGAAKRWYDSNHDSYLTVVKKDTIVTKMLPPKSFQTNFKVHDSVAVFLTLSSQSSYLYFINVNTFDSIQLIKIHQKLGLKTNQDVLVNRLIYFDGKKCLFVASRYKSDIDYIVQVDLSTSKFEKILQIGNEVYDEKYHKTHKLLKPDKESHYDMFVDDEYPHRKMYSYDNGKLFVLYESKGVMCIDTYKSFD